MRTFWRIAPALTAVLGAVVGGGSTAGSAERSGTRSAAGASVAWTTCTSLPSIPPAASFEI
jgi:hypothetical protein